MQWYILLIKLEALSSPYSRLYWTEVSDLGSQMFYYSIINETLSHILPPVATNHSNGRRQCFCGVTQFEFNGTMTVDTSDLKKPQIYFVKGQEIWAMDLEGCQCWQVIILPGKTAVCVCAHLQWRSLLFRKKEYIQKNIHMVFALDHAKCSCRI